MRCSGGGCDRRNPLTIPPREVIVKQIAMTTENVMTNHIPTLFVGMKRMGCSCWNIETFLFCIPFNGILFDG